MYQYLGLGVLYQAGDQVFHCILKQTLGYTLTHDERNTFYEYGKNIHGPRFKIL